MSNSIKRLDDRSYVLLRPELYLGAMDLTKSEIYFYENNKIVEKEVEYVPGFIKTIEEFLDNGIDQFLRQDCPKNYTIKVNMYDDYYTLEDSGNGIPVKKNEDGEYLPKVAWGYLRSSGNFDDEGRKTLGKFGVGSAVSVIYSKKFKGISCDGNNKIICE